MITLLVLGAVPAAARQATPSAPEVPPDPDLVELLQYDEAIPLDVQEIGVEERDGAVIRDITYVSPGRTVEAYLVEPATANGTPAADSSLAGIVYFHWLAPDDPTANRTEFLEEAVALAPDGVVSVLIQGVFPWTEPPTDLDADRTAIVHEIQAARRAFDLLLARPDVDPDRLAFVGHDYGAMYGAALAAVDGRPAAYVMLAATPRHADWNIVFWLAPAGMTPADQQAYREGLSLLDPLTTVASAAPAAILFQVASQDYYISVPTAYELYAAASGPKEIEEYESDHKLNEEARVARNLWLRQQLQLPGA
jgi:hypothetical protein